MMNKKFVLSIVLVSLLLSVSTSHAQLFIKKGLKGGLNFASLSSDMEADYRSKTGMVFGGYLKINLVILALQAELLYSPKGATVDVDGSESEVKVNYFELPLLLKYKGSIAPLVSYNLHAGPAFAFKISEEMSPKTDNDIFKSSDVGIVFGVGLNISALISEVNIDARYTMGINNVYDGEGDTEIKNKVFSVLLGIGL